MSMPWCCRRAQRPVGWCHQSLSICVRRSDEQDLLRSLRLIVQAPLLRRFAQTRQHRSGSGRFLLLVLLLVVSFVRVRFHGAQFGHQCLGLRDEWLSDSAPPAHSNLRCIVGQLRDTAGWRRRRWHVFGGTLTPFHGFRVPATKYQIVRFATALGFFLVRLTRLATNQPPACLYRCRRCRCRLLG